MSLTTRTLLTAAALAATAALSPAEAASEQAIDVACDPNLVAGPGSLIGDHWRTNGGEHSVFGCPITKEFGYPNRVGSFQRFVNGQIMWSPALGGGNLLRVYNAGNMIVFRWGRTQRDWDYFNVRWRHNTGGPNQVRVGRETAWTGFYGFTPNNVRRLPEHHGTETFTFSVQGCDREGIFQTATCGSWSDEIWIPRSF